MEYPNPGVRNTIFRGAGRFSGAPKISHDLLRLAESKGLAYAVVSGKAVISMPYWDASELLQNGR
jgi:hypothetical protein